MMKAAGKHGGVPAVEELAEALEAQRAIKRALDPQNILNPGKMGMDAAYA